MSEQVAARQPAPRPATAATGILQRKCACGRHTTDQHGECTECRKKRTALQRRAVNPRGPDIAPPIVHEVLRSAGRPLDSATRHFMEPRFGRDFSGVRVSSVQPRGIQTQGLVVNQPNDPFEREAERMGARIAATPVVADDTVLSGNPGPHFDNVQIHTDARAAESARAVNAHAYTVGQHIVFGAGQFAPHTPTGQRLLAHELTHTMQQAKGSDALQRFVSCTTVTMSGADCPTREPDEVRIARETGMVPLAYNDPSNSGQLVANFAVGRGSVKVDLAGNYYWNQFSANMIAHPEVRWEILGFSDCEGDQRTNISLREERAAALYNALPAAAQRQIVEHKAAPISDCIADNANRGGRALNRSALVRRVETTYDFEEERVEGERARFVCGPDVTEEVARTIARLRSTFAGFTRDQQEASCDALISYSTGEIAWDIVDLCDKCRNGNIWISRDFRPTCATRGARPPCGPSVQVGGECFFSGSANYVIYGVMFSLCHAIDSSEFNESEMLEWIQFYKTKGGLVSASGNTATAKAWAQAGYSGWAGGSAPVSGDRSNCRPLCPLPYPGPAFRVRWCPDLDPDGLCASGSR